MKQTTAETWLGVVAHNIVLVLEGLWQEGLKFETVLKQ